MRHVYQCCPEKTTHKCIHAFQDRIYQIESIYSFDIFRVRWKTVYMFITLFNAFNFAGEHFGKIEFVERIEEVSKID